MIQKQSTFVPSDRSGVWLVRVIHTYTKLSRVLKVNYFGKVSIIQVDIGSMLRKKKKKFLYTRQSVTNIRQCGSLVQSKISGLILKKRLTPVGRRVIGFCDKKIIRKKAISSFIQIL